MANNNKEIPILFYGHFATFFHVCLWFYKMKFFEAVCLQKNFFKRFYERQYINMYIIRNNVRFSLDFLNRVQGQNGEKKSIVQNFCTPEASKK